MAGYQGTSTRQDGHEALAAMLEAERRDILTSAKGKVVAYDAATQLATVRPLMTGQFGDAMLAAPDLQQVRVRHPRGGGHALHLPMKPGDDVTLHFYARGHDASDSDGSAADHRPGRLHDISDAVAVPGGGDDGNAMAGLPANAAHFGSADGKRGLQTRDDGSSAIVGGPDGADKLTISAAGKVDLRGGADGDSLLQIVRDLIVAFRDHSNRGTPLDAPFIATANALIVKLDGMRA